MDNSLRRGTQHCHHADIPLFRWPRRLSIPLRRRRDRGRHVYKERALPPNDGVYSKPIHRVRIPLPSSSLTPWSKVLPTISHPARRPCHFRRVKGMTVKIRKGRVGGSTSLCRDMGPATGLCIWRDMQLPILVPGIATHSDLA
jgi:hypothetical protein